MDLIRYLDRVKLLIICEFKYFTFINSQLVLKDGHFLNGSEFCVSVTNGLCFLKVNGLDLKFNEGSLILTNDRYIGSHIVLEAADNISFYLKHFEGYFNKDFQLVDVKDAVKVQVLWGCEGDEFSNLPISLPINNRENNNNNNILSIEGIQLNSNDHQFKIILEGNCYDYATEFEGQFFFGTETFRCGVIFELVSIKGKLTLFSPELGYLGKSLNKYGYDCVMYSKEIPEKIAYLIPYRDPGMYALKCDNEYIFIDWVKSSCGFNAFTESISNAHIFQFINYTTVPNEN